MQDALIKILDSLHQYRGQSKFTTWAMSIAVRTGISDLRRKYHRDMSIESFSTEDGGRFEVAVDSSEDHERTAEMNELLMRLQSLIDEHLTERQRIVICSSLMGY